MGITAITPFVPLTLRGRLRGRGGFGIGAFGFHLSFGFVWDPLGLYHYYRWVIDAERDSDILVCNTTGRQGHERSCQENNKR
jgi:hypothetical protein